MCATDGLPIQDQTKTPEPGEHAIGDLAGICTGSLADTPHHQRSCYFDQGAFSLGGDIAQEGDPRRDFFTAFQRYTALALSLP